MAEAGAKNYDIRGKLMAQVDKRKRTKDFVKRPGGITDRRDHQDLKSVHRPEGEMAMTKDKQAAFVEAEARRPERGDEPLGVNGELEGRIDRGDFREIGIYDLVDESLARGWIEGDDEGYHFNGEADEEFQRYLTEVRQQSQEAEKEFDRLDHEIRRPEISRGTRRASHYRG